MLRLLDLFLHIFHLSLISFALVGWAFASTRGFHLALMLGMTFFWIVVGKFKGLGFCPITEAQWALRRKMNKPIGDSYISFVLEKFFPGVFQSATVDRAVWIIFSILSSLSILLNLLG